MYWDLILKDLKEQGPERSLFTLTRINEQVRSSEAANAADIKPKSKRRDAKKYRLGEKYKNIYLTQREADCMQKLLQGKTVITTAQELNLSPRTVEFYLKNMKAKLRCRTKFELLDLVHKSDFLKNF